MTKKISIAHIVQHLSPGGIEAMVLDFQALDFNKNNVHIISLESTKKELKKHWPRIKNINNFHTLNKPPGINFSTIWKLSKLLKLLKIDIIHTHHVGPLIYGGIAAKLAKCGHIHTEHDAWHLSNIKRRLLVHTCFKLLKPTVVADAKLVQQNIQKHIPNYKTEVIMNGINTDYFKPTNQQESRKKLQLPSDKLIIGCAARFTKVKAHHILLSAFSDLPNNVHLALAGIGELENDLKHQAKILGLSKRVHFLGLVNQMTDFYNSLDVFCLSSLQEGLPLSPLEAQACQKNIVLTDVGGCSEALAPTGELIQPNNTEMLTLALKKQLETGCTQETQKEARNFVLQHGDFKKVLSKYYQLYCLLLKNNQSKQGDQ